jgi:hypothetical protein
MTTDLALVETPTGPTTPPPLPKPAAGQKVDGIAAMTLVAGTLTALAVNVHNGPDLVGYPIGAALAATVIGGIVLARATPRTF